MRDIFTIKQAAELLQLHEETLRRAIRAGNLKAAAVGSREYRISRLDLEAWYQSLGGGKLFEERAQARELALELWDNLSQREILDLLAGEAIQREKLKKEEESE